MIEIKGAAKTFRTGARVTAALEPIDLAIADGEFVSFIGPSGCGKSTLLNMIAGIIAPSSGAIVHDGRTVAGANTATGYMTQQDSLLPWRTAAANIALPLALRRTPPAAIDARVAQMLALVGLANFGGHFPAELSGGMKKRVALAQILAYDPPTLLMDEPFGALDAQLKLIMQGELMRIWENAGKTIVFVTHDLAEAITLSDRVAVFSSRPGRIKAVETIDLPRPRDPLRIQFEPAYRAVHQRLWDLLAPEIEASRAEAFA
ncbi:MAG: ABC transporter ATP-binding protein [Burkholderiales bacterium]|nr:ABC transporter ATP-binding protein [Burkholderiales bacterium]